jgi:hypothetical protein
MDRNRDSADFCARCKRPLEIITVRFKFAGAEVISACSNCPMTDTESAPTGREATAPLR